MVKIWDIDSDECVRMMMDWSMRQMSGATSVDAQNADTKSEDIRPARFSVLYLNALSSLTDSDFANAVRNTDAQVI